MEAFDFDEYLFHNDEKEQYKNDKFEKQLMDHERIMRAKEFLNERAAKI